MFKILKKYSKLLALALVFSSSIPFASFATAPQEPNKPATTKAIKREREEYFSEEESDIPEGYNIGGLVGMFNFSLYPDKVRPRCGLLMKYNPCNRRTSRFYLLPDYEHNVIAIGRECLKKNFGSQAHKIAYSPEKDRKHSVIKKILSYFLGKNWYQKCDTGNYVLDLTPLLSDPDLKESIKCKDDRFTIFFNYSKPTKENPNCYDMAYDRVYVNNCKAFRETYTLADKKFAAFCYFCKKNKIL